MDRRVKHPSRIARVSTSNLADARAGGIPDEGVSSIRAAEKDYLDARRISQDRAGTSEDDLSALCISGGGIRSAMFATGVLQVLARAKVLKSFDYLSTVSGGGYIGSSISWLLGDDVKKSIKDPPRFGLGPRSFPYGTENPEARRHGRRDSVTQIKMLQYLKSHGKYLTPGSGVGLFSLVAVILRGMFLTLLIMIPLIASLFTVYILFFDTPREAFKYLQSASLWLLGFLAFASIVYGISGIFYKPATESSAKYDARRFYDRIAGLMLGVALLLIVISVTHSFHVHFGSAALVIGAQVGALVFSSIIRSKQKISGIKISTVAPVGAALLLYGMLVLAHRLGEWSSEQIRPFVESLSAASSWSNFLEVFRQELPASSEFWTPIGLLFLSLVCGWLININYVSIHRYYRDRLMETFMPDLVQALTDATGPSRHANSARLSRLMNVERPTGPYHILNTNINLSGSDSRLRRLRGGDSFILSPLYCGSSETGWRSTREFMRGGLTVATAMAVSGAAAEPDAGVGGRGVTRSASVSMLMSMLNLSLGFWIRHPLRDQHIFSYPTHFNPGMASMLSSGYNARRSYLELGDGGHFENLGLYEMIRRRARLIVATDGGADPEYKFTDLLNALRKIDEDFGARIVFLDDRGREIQPTDPFKKADGKLPKTGHLVGDILYADGSRGVLILIKLAMVSKLDFHILAYQDKHPNFPHQSTTNQAFTEEQSDAYRRLGYEIGRRMIDKVGVDRLRLI